MPSLLQYCEILTHDVQIVKELPIDMTNTTPDQDAQSTQVESETTVAQLRASLAEAEQKESRLQQQIADLQLELSSQAKLKAELEQAKNTALKLAEANFKLIEEIKVLKNAKQHLNPEAYKKGDGKIISFANQHHEESSDFASKSWLLD